MNEKMCRLCGENEGTSYIFSPGEQTFVKLVYCCAKLTITNGDGLPAYICENCKRKLHKAYQFLRKCEKTDLQLRSIGIPSSSSTEIPIHKNSKHSELEIEIKEETDEITCTRDSEEFYEDIQDNCFLSEEGTKIKSAFQRQKKRLNKKKSNLHVQCSVCGQSSASASALVVHMRNHTGETPFQCPNCDKQYKDQGNLKNHIKMYHTTERKRDFICEHCGKGFFTKNDVKIHMRVHTGETPYECTECSRKFTQIGALIRHKKRHTGDKPHVCSICGKTFSTKDKVKNHLKVHSDEKNYLCTICNTPFKYQTSLRKHMVLHSAPNSFVCNYCGRTFNKKGNLKLHIDRQHSEKSGYCNICSKNVSDVEVHMWKHTGQRPLKCEYCLSSFFEMKALARHMNYKHKHPDKFKCSIEGCSMTFPAKAMLEFHTAKLHETGFPYPCDRCTRGYYRKNDLARHKIGTHKERLL